MQTNRTTQLRRAKRRQRQRDKDLGLVVYQVKLPGPLAERLKIGLKHPRFAAQLETFLQRQIIEVAAYPQLELLCWNLKTRYVTREDAFRLYERNWRLVDPQQLDPSEQQLIDELTGEFGQGLING